MSDPSRPRQPPPEPRGPTRFPAGLGNAYIFSAFNALSFQVILGSPMVLYAGTLGAGATVLGIIIGMMPLLVLLQMPAAGYVERVGYRRFLLAGWTTRVAVIFGIAAVPMLGRWFDTSTRLSVLLGLLFAFNLSRGISSAGWLPWISHLVPEDIRGRYLARDAICVQLASAVVLGMSAAALHGESSSGRFAGLFAFSGCMGVISLRFLRRIPDVTPPEATCASREAVPWRAIAGHRPFRKLLAVSAAWAVAYGGIPAFMVAFLREGAGWAETPILVVTAASYVGGLVGLAYFEPRIDRTGSRPVMALCLGLWLVVMAAWLGFAGGWLGPGVTFVAGVSLAMGFGYALFSMTLTRLAMLLAPAQGRSHFLALYSVVANLTLGLSPIVWGLVIDAWGSRRPVILGTEANRYAVFFAGSFLAFAVGLRLARRIEEPSARAASELVRELLSAPARALRFWQDRP